MYASFVRKSDEEIDTLYGKDFSLSPAARGRIRTFAQGLVGEAVTLYLSLFSALSQGKDALYPSSFREDNPPLEHVIPQYGNELHDAHTYNPVELSLRALLSVKTSYNKTGNKSDTVVLFRLLQNATAAMHEVVQHTDPKAGPQRIDINTVLDLLIAAEDIDSGLHGTAVTFRQKLADRLQDVIQTHPAMAKMKIEV